MQRIVVIGLSLGLMVGSASATTVRFNGAACLTAANATCNAEGWAVPQCFPMSYRPPNILDNGARSSLTFGFTFGASNHTLASGSLIGTTYQPVAATYVFTIVRQQSAQMRFTRQTPADLTTSQSVAIVGDIKDFDVPGCNIQFKAAGQRQ